MLNDDNTEFLLLGTWLQLAKVNISSITVGESVVNTKPVVRNLGSGFHSCLLYTSPSPRDQRGSRMPSSA